MTTRDNSCLPCTLEWAQIAKFPRFACICGPADTTSTARPTRCARRNGSFRTFTFEGFPDGVSLDTLTFEDLGDGRTRLVGISLLASFEGRDAMVSSGIEVGVREGYERLDELLAG